MFSIALSCFGHGGGGGVGVVTYTQKKYKEPPFTQYPGKAVIPFCQICLIFSQPPAHLLLYRKQ